MTKTSDAFSRWKRQRAAIREGRSLLPRNGNVDDLVAAVGARRGRAFRVLAIPLSGTATSGAWVPTAETDYLLHAQSASPTRREAVLCHELGHILLSHDPALHDALTPALLEQIAPHVRLSTAHAMLFRAGYTSREETAAEYVGTLLATALAERRDTSGWETSSRLSEHLR